MTPHKVLQSAAIESLVLLHEHQPVLIADDIRGVLVKQLLTHLMLQRVENFRHLRSPLGVIVQAARDKLATAG